MRVVAVLAVAALIALVIALLTGSTWAAAIVIALAITGIALLLRDWRGEHIGNAAIGSGRRLHLDPDAAAAESPLAANDFSPDLSTGPDGPSSDARAN